MSTLGPPNRENPARPPRLLDRVRTAIRLRHYSVRTERAYLGWIRRYIHFHCIRHPDQMGSVEVVEFRSHIAPREPSLRNSKGSGLPDRNPLA